MKKYIATSAAILAITILSGCAPAKEGNQSSNQTSSVAQTNSDTPSSDNNSSEDSSEANSDVEKYKIGDTVKTEGWEITVNSVDAVEKIQADYGSFKPEEGSKYVVLNVTVKNLSTESSTFLPSFSTNRDVRAKIKYQEYEFSATNLLGHSEDLHNTGLNPLSSKTGIIAFSIASDVAEKTDELRLVISENKKEYEFAL